MNTILKYTLLLAGLLVLPVVTNAQEHSWFNRGKLYIINSSHQDIAWMDAPEVCIQFRNEQMLTPALKRMAESPDFCFSVEDALSLKEYLERHPERYQEILQRTLEGRLEWGQPTNNPTSLCTTAKP
ncbi:MAG: hypothetical protein LUD02_05095 [Tannerellaceae bacterium]|nr:hypothetical protein [Tannerellaceae bacterium]